MAGRGYNRIDRSHVIVHHSDGEWARDDDINCILETYINTIEVCGQRFATFYPYRGVHKKYLAGYIAICEFAINIKAVTVEFISKPFQRTKS